MSASEYVCSLDEASLKVALDELHEDPKNRMGAVETLRTWLAQQKHIKFTTDVYILLAFLRYAKFSQLKARQTIENYCKYKTETPAWFEGFNPMEDSLYRLAKTGYIVPLPGYDEKGRKLVVHREAAYDPAYWKDKKDSMVRAMFSIVYSLVKDERCQVNGMQFLSDFSGLTVAHQMFFTLDDMKKQMRYWQGTTPCRFKGFYNYNCGPIFDALFVLFRPLLSKKMQDRMFMVGSNMADLYKYFPKEMLPVEYLPDDYTGPNAGTLDSLTENLVNDMRKPEMREFLALISKPDWRMDKAATPDDIPNASFRKLNVD